MDISDYLPPYIDKSLLEVPTDNPIKGFIYNPKKIHKKTLLDNHPCLKEHPFFPFGMIYKAGDYPFGKSLLYDLGAIYIMDPSSMLPALYLNPSKDDLILDMCAAPGGKSVAISLLMDQTGIIVSNDLSYKRSKETSFNCERMGLGNLIVTSTDFEIAKAYFPQTFDKIIVDAPCSMMALSSSNEIAKREINQKKIDRCAALQKTLLDNAAYMLKQGGTLLYSTCTFSYKEDEGVVLDFLKNHPDFEIDPIPKEEGYLMGETVEGSVYLLPALFPGEGQYIARLRKKGNKEPTIYPSRLNQGYKDFIDRFGLSSRSNETVSAYVSSLTEHMEVSRLNTLRYGVKLFEDKDIYVIPEIHLARYLDVSYSIPLDDKKAHDYLLGLSIDLEVENGFYIVSCKGLNMGFVKVVNGIGKNHYPKGYRRDNKDLSI